MGITTTLENISNKFAEWHSDTENSGQHDRIYRKIKNEIDQLNIKINDNDKNDILAAAIQKIIDNTTINDVNQINTGSINLKSLQDQINALNTYVKIQNYNTIKAYIDEQNASNDNGAAFYNKIINDTLIFKDITAGANLNTYTDMGIYRCTSSSTAGSLKNKPSTLTSSFILVVISQYKNTSYNIDERNQMIHQIIFQNHKNVQGDSSTKNDGYRIYHRYYQYNGATWQSWTELYGTHNTQEVTMRLEFLKNTQRSDVEYTFLVKK